MNLKDLTNDLDHVAFKVSSISEAVCWYKEKASAKVIYEDTTWALLNVFGIKLALVLPGQHPTHIAFKSKNIKNLSEQLRDSEYGFHRDGSEYLYLKDPFGNAIEWVCYNKNDQQNK